MNILAIDTSSEQLCVVLVRDGDEISRNVSVGKTGHSKILMSEVDALLCEADITLDALDAVAVVVGPGSFTGIRIGVATATALAFAKNLKRIRVTSFEVLAYNRATVRVAVEAGHGNAYVADCVDGEVLSCRFLTEHEREDAVLGPAMSHAKAIAGVVREKWRTNRFSDVLEPFYMRKSQAEREKDEI